MNKNKYFDWFYLAFLVITPIVLLLLPATFFDNGPTLCPSMRFFKVECPGCGMTRAIMYMIHFDFESALYYNWGCFIIGPILGFYWLLWIRQTAKRVFQKETEVIA